MRYPTLSNVNLASLFLLVRFQHNQSFSLCGQSLCSRTLIFLKNSDIGVFGAGTHNAACLLLLCTLLIKSVRTTIGSSEEKQATKTQICYHL